MRKIIFFLAGFCPYALCYGAGFGVCSYTNLTLPSIVCYGPAVIKDTTVSGDMKVAGAVKATNLKANTMTVTGSLDVENSKIKGLVSITGELLAKNSTFSKDITIEGDHIILDRVRLNGSMNVTSVTNTPYLTFQCGTIVTGSVSFTGRAGVIEITSDSLVQYKIKNGSQIFVKKECPPAN